MDPRYIGTVVGKSNLTIREGPGENYPIMGGVSLSPGDKVPINDVHKSGSTMWAQLEHGYAKASQGTTKYITYEKPPQPMMLSARSMSTYNDKSGGTTRSAGKTETLVPATRAIPQGKQVSVSSSSPVMNATMRLFGLPYQFNAACDPRYGDVSPTVGREFAQKFFADGPIMYVIPGRAKYLDNAKSSNVSGHAFIAATNGDLKPLQAVLEDARKKPLMFYDFQEDYNAYIKYVNMMCRTVAGFLQLKEGIQIAGKNYKMQTYDWRNYRWTKDKYESGVGTATRTVKAAAKSAVNILKSIGAANSKQKSKSYNKSRDLEIKLDDDDEKKKDILDLSSFATGCNYVMFYVDATTSCNETFSNDIGDSELQSKVDSLAASSRDMQFYAKSAGLEGAIDAVGDSVQSWFGDGLMNLGGPVSNVMNKILSTAATVVKGENIILPKIYQNSSYSKDYQVQIHLKTPYGDKLAIYTDVIVPMLHLLALVLPKQATANTYGSPYIIKAYVPGVFNCMMGVVTSMSIEKSRSDDAWSMDGLPMEMDITLTITDLYSKLSMSPTTEPLMFLNNSSLIEYLSTVAGLNLILPQTKNKIDMMINTVVSALKDITKNIGTLVTDGIDHKFRSFISL